LLSIKYFFYFSMSSKDSDYNKNIYTISSDSLFGSNTRTFPTLDLFFSFEQTRPYVPLFELILLFLNTSIIPDDSLSLIFSLSYQNRLILFKSTLYLRKLFLFFLINPPENHEVMARLFWIFWSAHTSLPITMKFISKVGLITLFYPVYVSTSPCFWFIFARFIHFCMSRIDRSRVVNKSLFHFKISWKSPLSPANIRIRFPQAFCSCFDILFTDKRYFL